MRNVYQGSSIIITISSLLFLLFTDCSSTTSDQTSGAEMIYINRCARCHGIDGKKGRKGAKDLTKSTKTLEYRINQLKEGKGKMPSFSDRLTEDQIKEVAQYTMSFNMENESAGKAD